MELVYLALHVDNIFDYLLTFLINCRDGEIGRHAGFKIQWPRGRAGSIPALGTNTCTFGILRVNQEYQK